MAPSASVVQNARVPVAPKAHNPVDPTLSKDKSVTFFGRLVTSRLGRAIVNFGKSIGNGIRSAGEFIAERKCEIGKGLAVIGIAVGLLAMGIFLFPLLPVVVDSLLFTFLVASLIGVGCKIILS